MKTPLKQEKKVMSAGLKKVVDRGKAIQAKQKQKKKSEAQTPQQKQNIKDAMENKNMRPPFQQNKTNKTKK